MNLIESDLAPIFERIRKGALGIIYDIATNGTFEMPPNTSILPNDHVLGTLNGMEKAFYSTAKILEQDLALIGEPIVGNGKMTNGMDFLRTKIVSDLNTVNECLIRSIQDRFGLRADLRYGIAIRRGYAIVVLLFARENVSTTDSDVNDA